MLEIKSLGVSIKKKRILDEIDCALRPGELVALLGMNGSGKSTLLKTMCGLIQPDQGQVLVDGYALSGLAGAERARRIGYLPQKANGIACPVFEAVLLGRIPTLNWRVCPTDLAAVDQTLEMLGLGPLAMRPASELSGGEFQKVAIARALAQEPRILLLDEPINHLDLKNQMELMATLQRITRELDLVTVTVLHDLGIALRYADRFLLIKDGCLHASGGAEVVTPLAIREVFGVEAQVRVLEGVPVVLPLASCMVSSRKT